MIEQSIHREFIAKKKTLALAESCTGGAIAARLVKVPGASLFLLGGIVAYSNGWKESFLGVRHATLSKFGAVSREVVEEMVQGLFEESVADYAVAVSGTLGPSGGTAQKPVGTLYIAIGKRGEKTDAGLLKAPGPREAGIEFAVETALNALLRRIAKHEMTFS
jgi:PncC family amidohydrolase